MDYKLKTCPFCGKPPITRVAVIRGIGHDEIAVQIICHLCEIKQERTIQHCDDFWKLEKAKTEAIEKWNRRCEYGNCNP